MMIEQQIAQILTVLLKQNITPNDNVSMQNCYKWDSMKHIEIILTLEEEFNISFEPEDIPELTSLSKIIVKVKELIDAK